MRSLATRPRRSYPFWLLPAAALTALAIYLRFAHLLETPGWDGDEGYNWSIASNLSQGRLQMYGFRYAFVQHPPLFYLLAAGLMRLWTPGLLAVRALSAACGVLTIGAVGLLGARLGGRGIGIAAALFLLLWPQAVLQARWAYTYNLLALLLPLALAAALPAPVGNRQARLPARAGLLAGNRQAGLPARAALLAGSLAGLALATDQEAVALIPALALLIWPWGRQARALGLLGLSLPPGLYVAAMLLTRRVMFLFDIQHTATRLVFTPSTLLERFLHLIHFDPLIGLGLLGLLLLPRGPGRRALLITTALLLLIVLAVRDPGEYFRAAEPLLPIVAVGMAAVLNLCQAAMALLVGRQPPGPAPAAAAASARQARLRSALALAVLVLPFAGEMLVQDLAGVGGRFHTSLDSLLPRSTAESRRMADWLNRRLTPESLVLTMPATSWLLHARTADLLQAVAINGHGTAFYPSGLARSRFAYDTSLGAASYLIIDDFTRRWLAENEQERHLAAVAVHSWTVVYHRGEYTVYARPARRAR